MGKFKFVISLFLLCQSIFLLAQEKITGTVTSAEDGLPLTGVTVLVKGTATGETTDQNGLYSIAVPSSEAILSFKYLGFKTKEVQANGKSIINIMLEPELLEMNEVVILGYGSAIKAELTGSISKFSGDDMVKTPEATFQTSLQGKIPGMFMTNTTGKLGEALNVRIRGTSSITANNQPLYVVDGVFIQSNDIGTPDNQPINPLMTLDPKDIESVEILKDASAAAIYGSRASNGVVIITTKSGKGTGGNNINFGYSFSLQKETNRLDLLNADQYLELISESVEYGYGLEPGEVEQFLYDNVFYPQDTVDVNWQDEIFRTGHVKDIYLNASGENEKSSYFAGLSFSDQQGIIVENDLKKYNGRLNFTNQVNNYVDVGLNVNFAQTRLNRVSEDNAFSTPIQLIAQAPITPAYLEDGEPNPQTIYFNSLLALKYNSELNRINRTISSGRININILPKELTFTSVIGADVINQLEETRISPRTDDGLPLGKGYQRTVSSFDYTFDNYFTYTKEISSLHNIVATLGSSYQESKYSRGQMGAAVFPGDNFIDLDAGAENLYFGTTNISSAYLSYFSRLNYKYSDKYLLSASLRTDGSSRFGSDKRWGTFYALSAGWIMSRESFIENIPYISFLKPRISYGTTGNANIIDYGYMNLAKTKPYAGKSGIYAYQLGISDLSWESTGQFDIGVDYGFFNNRITGEIDYYNKSTNGLLLLRNVPASNGFSGIYENIGELTNNGFEFLINASPNVMDGLKWNISANVAMNTNKVNKLSEAINYEYHRVEEGQPLGFFYLPKYAGVDSDNGDALYYDADGNVTNDYDEAEYQMVGNPNPKYFGGLSNMFQYRDFDLTIFFQFVADVDVYKKYGIYSVANADWFDNQTVDQMERWQEPGDKTDVPQARLGESNGTRNSSRYVQDASYLRLKDLSLGYTIPKNITTKYKLKSARLYISTKNILTLTKYDGFDPEVSAPNAGVSETVYNVEQGLDYYSTPQAKIITFGLDVTF